MPLTGHRDICECIAAGRYGQGHFWKNTLQNIGGQHNWFDGAGYAGNPPAISYAGVPLKAYVIDGSDLTGGIFHGANKPGSEVYLKSILLFGATSYSVGRYLLLDYLLYYPFVSNDVLIPQVMDNSSVLSRCTDGNGVLPMGVYIGSSCGQGGTFTFDYINQDGIQKTSPIITHPPVVNLLYAGNLVAANGGGNPGPFLPLAGGDSGVRRIVSVTNLSANGSYMAIVLVRPMANMWLSFTDAGIVASPVEVCYLGGRFLPIRIFDGAYLGFLIATNGSTSDKIGGLQGMIDYFWK